MKNNPHREVTTENREKISLEKEILRLRKELDKPDNRKNQDWKMWEAKEWEWIRKWGGIKEIPNFLFSGEEFNYELTKKRKGFKGSWKIVHDWDWHSDVIDFGKRGNVEPEWIKKRIREIWDYWNIGLSKGSLVSDYPIILFKNIDKITNSKLEKELLLIFNPKENDKYDKYQIKGWNGEPTDVEGNIDLSKFILVATTSTSNPQLSQDLKDELKHVESFFDKYKWFVFLFSLGIEIFIFRLLAKIKKITN
ncbi:MAG: hypothetical protein mread185_000099 [Mycoplasmataceae bacterium]|nr:MAG: hypothetical protein mread185_000099 [Mycoplasmataceae bacterium]